MKAEILESNILTPQMREYQKLMTLLKDKRKRYELAMVFLILSFNDSKKQKLYREKARFFLEISQGYCTKSEALIATFCGGVPSCYARAVAVAEMKTYLEKSIQFSSEDSEDNPLIVRLPKKWQGQINSVRK